MSVILVETKEILLKKIEQKRQQMLDMAQVHGMSDEKTLKYSQELDTLIVKYQRLQVSNSNETVNGSVYEFYT